MLSKRVNKYNFLISYLVFFFFLPPFLSFSLSIRIWFGIHTRNHAWIPGRAYRASGLAHTLAQNTIALFVSLLSHSLSWLSAPHHCIYLDISYIILSPQESRMQCVPSPILFYTEIDIVNMSDHWFIGSCNCGGCYACASICVPFHVLLLFW